MEDFSLLRELLTESPLAVLVGFTIYQLTKVSAALQTLTDTHQRMINDLIDKLTGGSDDQNHSP